MNSKCNDWPASCVYMVRPALFAYNVETAGTNYFQHSATVPETVLHESAMAEFDQVAYMLNAAGFEVNIFHSGDKQCPDAIFPNNWFSTHADGRLVLYPMFAPNRRRERHAGLLEKIEKEFEVKHIIDLSNYEDKGLFLEGTGSIVFDHRAKMAFMTVSPRSSVAVLQEICGILDYGYYFFNCFDAEGHPVYHTNVCMNFGEHYVMYCEEAIASTAERKLLRDKLEFPGREIIKLSMEQMAAFCGNMLQLKNREGRHYTVCSETAYRSLSREQRSRIETRSELLVVDIPVIEKTGGGGVRCMLTEIFLDKKSIDETDGGF